MRKVHYGYTFEERTLLLNSDHVRTDYPELYAYAKDNDKAIPELVDKLTDEGKKLDLLFSRENQALTNLIQELQLEWVLDKSDTREDPEKNLVCGLCGQTRVSVLWALINRYNKEVLWIGSECIRKYEMGKHGTEGKSFDEFLYEVKLHRSKNRRELDVNLNSNRSLYRFSVAKKDWEDMFFLPPPEITQEIVDLIDIRIPAVLQPLRDASQDLDQKLLKRCDALVSRLESLLVQAHQETRKPTEEWRVCNAVYKWAKAKDKKKRKNDEAIVPILERTCAITPESVALILEEGHKRECIKRMSNELPRTYRVGGYEEQTDRIKIYFSVEGNEYPLWVPYRLFVQIAVKNGFPSPGSLSQFSSRELSYCAARIDMNDGGAGFLYLRDAIYEAGALVRDENNTGDRFLLSRYGNGCIVETNRLTQYMSNAIIRGERKTFLNDLRGKFNGMKWEPYQNVKKTWDELYGQVRR